jgi:hypothetical protein
MSVNVFGQKMRIIRAGLYTARIIKVWYQEKPNIKTRITFKIVDDDRQISKNYTENSLEVLRDDLHRMGFTYEEIENPQACLDEINEMKPTVEIQIGDKGYVDWILGVVEMPETNHVEEPEENEEYKYREEVEEWDQYHFRRIEGTKVKVRMCTPEGKLLPNLYALLRSRGCSPMWNLTSEQADVENKKRNEEWKKKKNQK